MSHSPLSPGRSDPTDVDRYLTNWDALATMIQRGASLSGRERHCFFLNPGTIPFADASAASGLDLIDDGRGLALVDWDEDGDLDMWISNRNGPRVRLMRNDIRTGHHFLALQLVGTRCNRDAIGARVELHLKTRSGQVVQRIKSLRAGEGFLSQSSKWIHFGLGQEDQIQRVVVRWPGQPAGETFADLAPDGRYRLEQGTGRAVSLGRRADVVLSPSVAASPPARGMVRTVLVERRPILRREYQDLDGRTRVLDPQAGRPLLITLWASWCPPCVQELHELGQRRAEYQAAGLSVLAPCVDLVGVRRTANLSGARSVIRSLDAALDVAVASEPWLRELSAVHDQVYYRQRPLPLPSSFLVDGRGRVAVVYKGPVAPDQVLNDLMLLDAGPQQIAEQASPFPGRPVTHLYEPHPLRFAEAYLEGGYLDDARREVLRYLQNVTSAQGLQSLADMLYQRFGVDSRPAGSNDPTAQAVGSGESSRPAEVAALSVQRALRAERRRGTIGALRLLATIERQRGDAAAELAAWRALVQLEPDRPTAHLDLALALHRNREADQAWRHVQTALRLAGSDPHQLAAVGQAQTMLGRSREGAATLRRAVEQAPSDTAVGLNYAMALYLNGDSRRAIDQYTAILRRDPQSHEAANNLAWIRATHPDPALRDGAQALELAQRLCESTGHARPEYLDTLAAALAELGRFAEAAATIERAIPLARARGNRALAEKLAGRRAQYQASMPLREPVTSAANRTTDS